MYYFLLIVNKISSEFGIMLLQIRTMYIGYYKSKITTNYKIIVVCWVAAYKHIFKL